MDPGFIEEKCFLVFAGELLPDALTEHRLLIDERIKKRCFEVLMRVSLDSSVLMSGLVFAHPEHARAAVWLGAVSERTAVHGFVRVHALVEVWAVLLPR